MQQISILNILEDTTVDGPGFRTAIYAAGCPHSCAGCHNPHSWNINNGTLRSIDSILNKIKEAEFSNVTFTGGDPFMQSIAFAELAKRIKQQTSKTIWCYTGYLFEEILQDAELSQLLTHVDVLVDGRFMKEQRDESLIFMGSRNQRIIDVRASLKEGKIVLWQNSLKPAFARQIA